MNDRLLSIATIIVLVMLIVLLLSGRRNDSIKADDVRPFPTNYEGMIELDDLLMQNAETRGRSIPEGVDIKELIAHLDSCGTDVERARAAYVWVCENIEYDLKALEQEIYVENPKDVFRDRKAICGGIANLYADILKRMGMQAVTVIGHLKGYGYSPGNDLTDDHLHAWNAVRLDRGWILVDCTLGSGFQDALSGYVRAYDPYYFASVPEEFIYTHYPKKEMWQMLDKPLTEHEFKDRPILKRAFFKNDLEFLSRPQAVYTNDSIFIFEIGNAPKKRTVVRVAKDGVSLDKDLAF